MYLTLLALHSLLRWLVLGSLLWAIWRGWNGWRGKLPFSKTDNQIRHWTATIAHIQLTIGTILYFESPITSYFMKNMVEYMTFPEHRFFGLIHLLGMFTAVIVMTIGSALAKRRETDMEKFKTMFIFFGVALLIIFVSIPWPFSPLMERPFFRGF